jgi:MarR family 2-MHQ and catechol resistance regulon transcriptional repressor
MPTHYRGDPRTVLALDTFIKFTRAANALEYRLAHHAQLADLTVSQFGVLETLYHLGPLCQGEIGTKLLRSSGNITLVLDNLEKRGLVERKRETSDRRSVRINLTPQGSALISELFPRQAAAIAAQLDALDPQEQVELGRLCKKLGKSRIESPSNIDPDSNIMI